MNIEEFHRTLKTNEFDPKTVKLDVPPELLAGIATVERAIAAGRITPAHVALITTFMDKYEPYLNERREHAVRREKLNWDALGR